MTEENTLTTSTEDTQGANVSDAVNTSDTTAGTGTGEPAKKGDTISVHYTGKLQDGTVFDSSIPRGEAFSFVIGQGMVIPGWEKGLLGMKVGEKKTLTIAPADAYGPSGIQDPRTGQYVIPPNATLIFDVEVVDIKR